LQSNEELVLIL